MDAKSSEVKGREGKGVALPLSTLKKNAKESDVHCRLKFLLVRDFSRSRVKEEKLSTEKREGGRVKEVVLLKVSTICPTSCY